MSFILFAEGVVILFFTFAQLLAKNKQPIHYCMILGCLTLAYMLMYFGAVDSGFLVRVPALAGSYVAASFLAAPSFYLSSLSILHEGKRPVRKYTLYFIAPAILAAFSLVYGAIAARKETLSEIPGHFSSPTWAILALGATLSFAVAVALDLFAAFRLQRASKVCDGSEFRGQVALLFCYLVGAIILLSSFLLKSGGLAIAGYATIGLIAVAYTLSHMGFSYFSQDHPPLPRRARPEWDKSAEELTSRLQALMEKTAPYRDEELTLQALARMLGIEPGRLSYHLNSKHSLTFRGYINDWRLRSVCESLLKCPDRSILDIAFENGFNSKSSFNSLFLKKYGMTPREYRRQEKKVQK